MRSTKDNAHTAQTHTDLSPTAIGARSASTHSTSQFKVVADKRQSILSDVGNPAGWVNRSADIDANKVASTRGAGDRAWASDAFNIVPGKSATGGHHTNTMKGTQPASHATDAHATTVPKTRN